jgi:hypothetical protein
MSSALQRTRRNAAVAIALFVIGGVLVKRSITIGAALIVCGLVLTYFDLRARRGRS